jgi:hypothetical protein
VSIRLADAGGTSGDPPLVTQHEEFLTGFVGGPRGAPKAKQVSWGRPADVQQLPDGSLLISDDGAHTVYRLHYVGDGAAAGRGGGAVAVQPGSSPSVMMRRPLLAVTSGDGWGRRGMAAGGALRTALVRRQAGGRLSKRWLWRM